MNTKTNTIEMSLTNYINEIKTMNNNNINIIGKKNYTYTTVNVNNNIIKNMNNNNLNIIGKKNYTYTTVNVNNNIITNI